MKRFITLKRKSVPRYKLYYLVLVFLILIIFLFNFLINFLLNHVSGDSFLNVLVGNSFGNVTEYQTSNLRQEYLYRNSFGILFPNTLPVMEENHSLENIVNYDLTNVVYIYNTFQTDGYLSQLFNSYNTRSYVTQASFILSEYLKEWKIGSIVEEKSVVEVAKEENIPYTNSYAASRILLEQRVQENNSLKYFFDLQISDYERDATTVNINGVDYAKILFVVGTDNGNYQDNQEFAGKLNQLLESINPSLSRGVSLRGGTGYQGVYNQDFSGKTLLIQVGGVYNTIDEVNRSMKVLAQVIATYIKEENHEKE